jgi:hypothetical protein
VNQKCTQEILCGINRESPDAEEVNYYTKWSLFLLLFGVSAVPYYKEFKCKRCGKIFDKEGEPQK